MWQTYADSIIATGHATGAILASCQTYIVVAVAGPIRPLAGEIEALVKRFIPPMSDAKLAIGGTKYPIGPCNLEYLTGHDGPRGICVAKSNKTIVIGVYGDGQNGSKCLDKVRKVATELQALNV